MLITTGVKLELFHDIEQLLFFEKGIRGGINGFRALRHFEANKIPRKLQFQRGIYLWGFL